MLNNPTIDAAAQGWNAIDTFSSTHAGAHAFTGACLCQRLSAPPHLVRLVLAARLALRLPVRHSLYSPVA